MVHDKFNNGLLKFPEKKEAMVLDKNPFPPVAIINTSAIANLKESLTTNKSQRIDIYY